jgi:hypothetical protein
MKRLLTAIAIALFAAGAGADDVYRGLAKGSPDLNEPHPSADQRLAVQYGARDSIDVHGGLGPGNPDLVTGTGTGRATNRPTVQTPGVYGGFCGGNPDLNC